MLMILCLIPFVLHLNKSRYHFHFCLLDKKILFYQFRMNEYRDFFNELKTRLDFEREDRRLIETQLASKYRKTKVN